MRTPRLLSPREAEGAGIPSAAPVPLKSSEIFLNRFLVLRHLGNGSLCAAYLCKDESNGTEVVVKVLQPRKAVSPAYTEDFLFLARSVAHYRHPGIARVLEAGRGNDEIHYVMEKIEGQPLRAWLLERLTFATRVGPGLALLRRLIAVFEVIHERGCYGVLKPENIFVHPTRGPVVMDFGVPGFLSPQEFEFNAHARRYLPYMAPELKRDWSNLLPQSDVYSLGAILYEILVGRPPALPLQLLPSEASARFGLGADEVVLKAMAANPFDRYDSLDAFDAALAELTHAILEEGSEIGAVEASFPSFISDPETETAEAMILAKASSAFEAEGKDAEEEFAQDEEEFSASQDEDGQRIDFDSDSDPNLSAISLNSFDAEEDGNLPVPERESAQLPYADAGRLISGDEGIPAVIWILLGLLAVALCVLAALLGAPATR